MKIIYEKGKIYKKNLFKQVEIAPSELINITEEYDNGMITLYFKDNRPAIQTSNVSFVRGEIDYFTQAGVYYEVINCPYSSVTKDKVLEQVEKIKEIVTPLASNIIKEKLGKEHDIDISVGGDLHYKYLMLRMKNNGVLVETHPYYSDMGDGLPRAIDLIEISFLYKWDAGLRSAEYGLLHTDLSESYWIDYLNICFKFLFQNG